MLQNTVDISRQATNLMKAGNLPQVMLTGGYAGNSADSGMSGCWCVCLCGTGAT